MILLFHGIKNRNVVSDSFLSSYNFLILYFFFLFILRIMATKQYIKFIL